MSPFERIVHPKISPEISIFRNVFPSRNVELKFVMSPKNFPLKNVEIVDVSKARTFHPKTSKLARFIRIAHQKTSKLVYFEMFFPSTNVER